MDWQTLVSRRAKKDPPSRGGWNVFLTNVGLYERVDPISDGWLSASCDKAFPGWPCDDQLEALRDAYARAPGDPERKALAEQLQVRAMQVGVYVPLGEVRFPAAVRKNVKSLLSGYFLTAWNVEVE